MDEVALKLLISKIDSIEKKIDDIIPKQSKIDEKTDNIDKHLEILTQKVEQKFEYSLRYAKDKVVEHENRCKVDADISVKKIGVFVSFLSVLISAIIGLIARIL